MKTVSIIGAGMGPQTLTAQALEELAQADLLLGAPRLLAMFAGLGKTASAACAPEQVAAQVRRQAEQRCVILVSGDTGFYSGAEGIAKALGDYRVRLIPGISSLSYFFSRLGLPWQDAAVVSCHGRQANLADTVRRHALTFALTGQNLPELGACLVTAGFGSLRLHQGQDLGTGQERIISLTAADLVRAEPAALSVLLVENPGYDPRLRRGIPDGEFLRAGPPLTKAEVRAACLAKLDPRPNDICWDIGAGSGSVTVEMALSAYQGRVYALDKNPEALSLARENCRRFHIGNVLFQAGSAPEALADWPAPDCAFIGGGGPRLPEITALILGKNPGARIVANLIALESLNAALSAFEAQGLAPEIVQIAVARNKKAGGVNLMIAQNPVYIISGGKHA